MDNKTLRHRINVKFRAPTVNYTLLNYRSNKWLTIVNQCSLNPCNPSSNIQLQNVIKLPTEISQETSFRKNTSENLPINKYNLLIHQLQYLFNISAK